MVTGYREGTTVIVKNKGKYQVGMVVGKIVANKKTLYDVFLESRSVISAVPRNAYNMQVYIDDNLTEKLVGSGQIVSTLPDYSYLVEQWLIPSYREEVVGPRSY